MSSPNIKDALDGLYGWWKRDKLSGTLIFILLPYLVTKMALGLPYSTNELIFVQALVAIIIG